MKSLVSFAVLLLFTACATTPPVQEMAAARSAIQMAKELPQGTKKAEEKLQSAEHSLSQAAAAIKQQHYEYAKQLAISAKRKAQGAAELKNKP
ncbi:MAG: DUF4398 domain-containing protein [Mariprofundaceae bacterium]